MLNCCGWIRLLRVRSANHAMWQPRRIACARFEAFLRATFSSANVFFISSTDGAQQCLLRSASWHGTTRRDLAVRSSPGLPAASSDRASSALPSMLPARVVCGAGVGIAFAIRPGTRLGNFPQQSDQLMLGVAVQQRPFGGCHT